MKFFTEEEVENMIELDIFPGASLEKDNGQFIIYTGIFEWKDGSYRDEPEK